MDNITAEEILKNKPTHPENIDYYHVSIVIMAMEEYAAGKVHQATKGNTCPHCDITPVMCKCCGEVLP